MRCDNCGLNDAAIHLTQIVNNEMTTEHLCDACAAAKGVDVGPVEAAAPAGPLTDFLAQIGKSLAGEAATNVGSCPRCGLTAADLKRTGRLGCADCYTHFAPHLRRLLRRLHGGTHHVGKQFAPSGAAVPESPGSKLASLRRSLQRAVDAEDFERAAGLRDQIRALEAGGASGEAGA
jgi:protein arginine kinase activator